MKKGYEVQSTQAYYKIHYYTTGDNKEVTEAYDTIQEAIAVAKYVHQNTGLEVYIDKIVPILYEL